MENKYWTDLTRQGWGKYRAQLETLRGKPYNPNVVTEDLRELCRAENAFKHAVTPFDFFTYKFTDAELTAHHQAWLDEQEMEHHLRPVQTIVNGHNYIVTLLGKVIIRIHRWQEATGKRKAHLVITRRSTELWATVARSIGGKPGGNLHGLSVKAELTRLKTNG